MNDRRNSLIAATITVVSAMLVVLNALIFVPESTQDRIIALPWGAIAPVLVPLITAGFAAVWQMILGPVTAPKPVRDLDATPIDSVLRPPRLPDRRREGSVGVDVALFVVAFACLGYLLGFASGCGASHAVREASVDETTRCIENEARIVAQQGTTLAEDRAAMQAERERCDAVRAEIRGAQ